MTFLRAFLILVSCSSLASAMLGFDTIQKLSVDDFKCLSKNGYSFYIARVGRSIGAVDATGIQNIKNAREAGWTHVDGYLFPCLKTTCPSAKNQVKTTLTSLTSGNTKIGTLWIDVEPHDWPTNKTANRAFILNMVEQAEVMGAKVGVYSNRRNWEKIVGLDWNKLSHKPLWYAQWNGKQNFDDFKPFGGWTSPAIHQFEGDVKGPCGVNMDKNWRP